MKALAAIAACLLPLPLLAANADEGRNLVAEKRCESCHASKAQRDAKAVYLRRDRKVTSLAKLKAQVALCNSELNLQLFPDDEEHIVAFLDREYYRFTSPAAPAPSPGTGQTR